MTVFSEVAKSFLLDALEAQIECSKEKDKPPSDLSSNLLSMFTPKRDVALSIEKRRLLSELMEKIKSYYAKNHEKKDFDLTRDLIHLIRICKETIEQIRTHKAIGPGTTDNLLENLISFLTKFHQLTEQLKLNDQPHEREAFSIFLTVITSYHARRILDESQKSRTFKNVLEHPSVSPMIAFQTNLENEVNNTLHDALENLNCLSQTPEHKFKQAKNQLGKLNIRYLLLKHQAMHDEYKFSISSPLLPYYLNTYLKAAQIELNGIDPSRESQPERLILERDDYSYILTKEEEKDLAQLTANGETGESLRLH